MAMPAPHLGPWTQQDILAFPDDGQRYELVEGHLIVSPSPSGLHQLIAHQLARLLNDVAPPPLRAVEALGVSIPRNYQIPDVLVADKAAIAGSTAGLDPKAALMVIEIVSPGSIIMDRSTKPQVYARAGIPTFWRVEIKRPAVYVYRLKGDSYQEVSTARAGERLIVTEPFKISFDPGELIA